MSHPHTSRFHPGLVVGGFTVQEPLGQGGMGEVWLAEQRSLRRPVAIKRINAAWAEDAEFVARFEREAQVVASIANPHVVTVHDYGIFTDDEGGSHCLLVMEYIDGGRSLGTVIDRPVDWVAAAALIVQVADGLAAAAAQGVVHRDIKPDNILITRDGLAKIVDFGLARGDSLRPITVAGKTFGSMRYIAPEQINGGAVDQRADIYALGGTWYHLVTGQPPYGGATLAELVRAHLDAPVPDAGRFAHGQPAAISALIARCLAKAPDERFSDAAALGEALTETCLGLGLALPPRVPGLSSSTSRMMKPGTRSHLRAADTGAATAITARVDEQTMPITTPPMHQDRPRSSGRPWLVAAGIAAGIAAVVIAGAAGLPMAWPRPAPSDGGQAGSQTSDGRAVAAIDRPAWADAAGNDGHGAWAAVTVDTATLRFRRMAGGTFLSGASLRGEALPSPTIVRPFWLLDREVDAAQFAALGGPPSTDDRPAGSVSWLAARNAALRLTTLRPRMACRLPTALEWEWAARSPLGGIGLAAAADRLRTAAADLAASLDAEVVADIAADRASPAAVAGELEVLAAGLDRHQIAIAYICRSDGDGVCQIAEAVPGRRGQTSEEFPAPPADLERCLRLGVATTGGAFHPHPRGILLGAWAPIGGKGLAVGVAMTPAQVGALIERSELAVFSDARWDAIAAHGTPRRAATAPMDSLGLYDLAGNLAEWCADAWAGDDRWRISKGASIQQGPDEGWPGRDDRDLAERAVPWRGFRLAVDATP